MVKQKGLGRGLDALLGGDVATVPAKQGERLMELPLSALQPGKYQPRTQMDAESIGALAASLRAQGMIQPILARAVAEGRYEIIAGERRWRAAQQAGFEKVPVVVREVRDEVALAMALIENIQREDLNAIEEAAGIQRLIDEFGMTHQSAADAIGRSRTAVSNLLRLLQLPRPIQQMITERRLEMGHARALLGLGTAQQLELAERIASRGLSVREAERAAAPPASRRRPRPGVDPDVRRLEEELADGLGARVQIVQSRRGAGRLVIHFSSLDQLDGLLSRLPRSQGPS